MRTPDRDPSRASEWPTIGAWLRHKLPEYVDVGGMLLLLGATRRTAGRGSTLYLAGCNAMLIRLLVLTGNLDAVNVVPAQRAGPDGASGGDC